MGPSWTHLEPNQAQMAMGPIWNAAWVWYCPTPWYAFLVSNNNNNNLAGTLRPICITIVTAFSKHSSILNLNLSHLIFLLFHTLPLTTNGLGLSAQIRLQL